MLSLHLFSQFFGWNLSCRGDRRSCHSPGILSVCNTKEAPGVHELLSNAPAGTRARLCCCRGDASAEGTEIWRSGDLVHSYWCVISDSDCSHLAKRSTEQQPPKTHWIITSKIVCAWIKELLAFVDKYWIPWEIYVRRPHLLLLPFSQQYQYIIRLPVFPD